MSDVIEAPAAEPSGELALTSPQLLVPAVVFAPGRVKTIIDKLCAQARATPTDISTPKGREAIKSLVYKIARSKTTLDKMGKELTDEWRLRMEAVNAERRQVREQLDALGEEVRAPLTEWENAEKARIAGHEAALASICERPGYGTMETAAEIRARLEHLRAFPTRDWQEFTKRAGEVLAAEIGRTEALLAAAERREAEQAEYARLRAEAEEQARQAAARVQAEREARIAAEAAEAARVEAEKRAQAEADAAARRAELERQAAARAQQEANERAARLEAQARQAEADRMEAEARSRREAAAAAERAEAAERAADERARKAEAERMAAEARAERAQEQALADERRRVEEAAAEEARAAAARAADREHRGSVNREAAAAMVAEGVSEAQAKALIVAIVAGKIPAVSIRY